MCSIRKRMYHSTEYLGFVHKIPSGKMSSRSKQDTYTHTHTLANKQTPKSTSKCTTIFLIPTEKWMFCVDRRHDGRAIGTTTTTAIAAIAIATPIIQQ